MKLYHLGLHFSCHADLNTIFTKLGHEVHDDSLSGHNWILGMPTRSMPMFEQGRWNLDFVKKKKWEEFYNTYHGELDQYDAFVVTYPTMWSMLYHKWDKPIIVQAPIRYDYGLLHLPADWQYMNQFLRERIDAGKLFFVANSKHDKAYAELFIEREVTHIPSLCEYMGRKWNPGATRIAMYLRGGWPGLPEHIELREAVFKDRYSWDVLNQVKGIVHFPYATSTMSVFEFYTSNFPMFIPSHNFCCEMYEQNIKSEAEPILWHWCNTKMNRMEPYSTINWNDRSKPDPNMHTSMESFRYWTKHSDFFDTENMLGIQLFNSMDELSSMTQTVNYQDISSQMQAHNAIRIPKVYEQWKEVLAKVEAARS